MYDLKGGRDMITNCNKFGWFRLKKPVSKGNFV